MRFQVWLGALAVCLVACSGGKRSAPSSAAPAPLTPEALSTHCREAIGEPRVEQVSERVFVAIGYDLANTIVIKTDSGRVVVDAMMSPERAQLAKAALDARVPGPTQAVIFTHSHIDHVGGASVWLEPETELWATAAFSEHFLKQYGVFQAAERARGLRQFGAHVSDAALPCSALGRKADFAANVGAGFRMPTHTFSGSQALVFGGVKLELVEAHGETDDQLFVWLPDERALLPGDNYYQAFPNLYTIRGTRPRNVERWILSLDAMRRREPELLLPSHTVPVRGREAIRTRLTDYRDAMAYLRAKVVMAANRGESLEALRDHTALPAHLAGRPYLLPLYGEVPWSVQAMYGNELGWFDGHTQHLYPLPAEETARRELSLMGGADKVFELASRALNERDPRWALHLLGKLEHAGLPLEVAEKLVKTRVLAERALAEGVANTNGRGYLLETAHERELPAPSSQPPKLGEALLASIPVRVFFEALPTRLRSDEALEVHETLSVALSDAPAPFHITVRRGVAEVVEGQPLAGTPKPVAVLHTDCATFKQLALQYTNPLLAIAQGKLSIEGDALAVRSFFARFQQEL